MGIDRFVCVTVGLSLFASASGYVNTAGRLLEDKTESPPSLSRAGSPRELAVGISKLLSSSPRSELGRLASVPDCTTAMAAGWERVRRTMPETEQEDAVGPDLLAISRFLGLIEGRLHVPIPKTWEETVKSATGRGQRNIWFPPRSDLLLPERNFEWLVERDGAQWLVKKDSQLIKVPAGNDLGPLSRARVECTRERAYVAVYGSLSDAYPLIAVDQANGKVLWSSKVWGTSKVWPRGIIVNTSGSDWHVVTMRSSSETLVIFGFSSRAVYVEAFDRNTGENRCRFSTAYFDFDTIAPRK
jgi:hypothetical protein